MPLYCQVSCLYVAGIGVEAGEHAVILFGILVAVLDDVGDVGVGQGEVAEPQVVLQDVVDDPAEEGDVAAGPDRRVDVGQRARCG